MKTLHDFTMKTIKGEDCPLSTFKGKKVMVVNTASKCGLTPQYAELEKLYREFGPDKFVILGFPANNFLWQEPGTDQEIAEFCSLKYEVSFPMFSKISVRGAGIHPLYRWLTKKEENGVMKVTMKWNFQKFLIDEEGKWVDVVMPKDLPYSPRILEWLKS